jgi:MFS family permease
VKPTQPRLDKVGFTSHWRKGNYDVVCALTFHIVYLIAVCGIIMSIAWSGTSLTTTGALLSRWFQRRRAIVLSLSTAGTSAGGLLLVPLAMAVLQRTGWRITWVALGVLVLVVAWPLAWCFLKDDPTDLGLMADGEQPSADGHQVNPTRAAERPLQAESWRMAVRSWPFWQLSGAYCVCGFTTAVLTTHFIPYAIDRGFTPSTTATALGVMNGLNVVGVIVMGMLADRWGRKNLLALVYAGRGGAYALLSSRRIPGASGASRPSPGSRIGPRPPDHLAHGGRVRPEDAGHAQRPHLSDPPSGGAASIQFAGLMRDVAGSYTLPLTIAGIALLPAAVSAFSIREQQYSGQEQKRPPSTAAVYTTAAPV